jgi:hypothetical protein
LITRIKRLLAALFLLGVILCSGLTIDPDGEGRHGQVTPANGERQHPAMLPRVGGSELTAAE